MEFAKATYKHKNALPKPGLVVQPTLNRGSYSLINVSIDKHLSESLGETFHLFDQDINELYLANNNFTDQ